MVTSSNREELPMNAEMYLVHKNDPRNYSHWNEREKKTEFLLKNYFLEIYGHRFNKLHFNQT